MDLKTGRPSAAAMHRLGAPDDARGLARFALHLGLLGLTAAGIALTRGSLWVWPAMLLHGIAMVALFAPLHESVHRTAFASRRLNDWVAAVCGFVVILPARFYRHFHMAHHRHTQMPGLDPEIPEVKPTTFLEFFLQASAFNYWKRALTDLWRHGRGRVPAPFVPARERPAVVREARLHAAGYAAIAVAILAGWQAPLWYWLLPFLLGQPWLRLYLMAEHVGLAPSRDFLACTRTTLTTAPVRLLMWNMPYHAEHHAWPGIPFHALPAAHRTARHALPHVEPGYGAFHRRYLSEIAAGRGRAFILGGVDPAGPAGA